MTAGQQKPVKAPFGEAYAVHWNWWLRTFAQQAMQRYPELYEGDASIIAAATDPLTPIDRLYRQRGSDAVFWLARALGRPKAFDVLSLVLTSSPTVSELVRRWRGFLALQADVRFKETAGKSCFVSRELGPDLVLSPYLISPANRKPYGPAMLAGVAAGTLDSAGLVLAGIWSIPRGRAAQPLYRFGTFVGEALDFDSDIVFRLAEGDDTMHVKPAHPPHIEFQHLRRGEGKMVHTGLLARVISTLENVHGAHAGLPATAARIGMSPRSLSRRLSEAGLGYGQLARFIRLRSATQMLARVPPTSKTSPISPDIRTGIICRGNFESWRRSAHPA
ncbi:hypothetical protein [Labrenzia sp. VG12]|uniref:hypothetical protein n=1 Tax=Labrenzia sp. VG12 TaxID=2021862 RepID=UPI000B8C2179|nr:hypothetical protein [Labrenzia sp. VG12]ASP32653.1 hypothetical protein CHH27_04850 [Labrenzia sp. VG12]